MESERCEYGLDVCIVVADAHDASDVLARKFYVSLLAAATGELVYQPFARGAASGFGDDLHATPYRDVCKVSTQSLLES